ncbi:hypothetical protein AB0N17_14015 [Streptomyces sp. NPDC051133]|uniref:hypothetical protein n=1 Tax=Streptomyces sp. NPDC051133 TaxID=3155521 RepID=UPI00342BF955
MTAKRQPDPGPVPRDPPDQQAGAAEDRWDVAPQQAGDETGADADAPDPDEAGAGPRGAPRSGTAHPEHPAPDEPSA